VALSRREWLLGTAALVPAFGRQREVDPFEPHFLEILNGYLAACRNTSPSYAVCDFPHGTILPGSVAVSGKTYDSVSRMMPALSAWWASGRRHPDLTQVLVDTFRHAFDPQNPDYWGPSPADHQHQKQVESSLVAWSIFLLGDKFLGRLNSRDRANIQAWLASCTQVPVRHNNWAWFTAVNRASRLALSSRWNEFQPDVKWMEEDVRFLDTLAKGDGWYSDSTAEPVYDYYNFWVFASHFLYWNRIAGERYPHWRERFTVRLRQFLESTPYFFGANGSHVLFGRSLIYRWAVVTPLVLAYLQKLWPYSPGLLRTIVEKNINYLWDIGAFDQADGKLLETFTPEGSKFLKETYVDNGHPYWGMQAYALLLIPRDDPFWTATPEPLPVERGDFTRRFDPLGMMLTGNRQSGQVRWLESHNVNRSIHYRDKYSKFVYLSHFPFNLSAEENSFVPDNAVVIRNRATGQCAYRERVLRGEFDGSAITTTWTTKLANTEFEIASRIEVQGDFELREHRVTAHGPLDDMEIVEGSAPLGGEYTTALPLLRADSFAVGAWSADKADRLDVLKTDGQNVTKRRAGVITLTRAIDNTQTMLSHVFYASPLAASASDIERNVRQMLHV